MVTDAPNPEENTGPKLLSSPGTESLGEVLEVDEESKKVLQRTLKSVNVGFESRQED